jgi:23S rRNA (adenine2030-N6)-methyltransferase
VLHELAPIAASHLRANLGDDPRVHIEESDGLAALPTALARHDDREVFALVDPPYSSKPEWLAVPDAVLAAVRARPDVFLMLWYPVKSLTRPNAMLERLRSGGLHATTLELVTTPLDLKKKRLNGSGVVLVNPPRGLVESAAAAAPTLGAACATHEGRWSMRVLGF